MTVPNRSGRSLLSSDNAFVEEKEDMVCIYSAAEQIGSTNKYQPLGSLTETQPGSGAAPPARRPPTDLLAVSSVDSDSLIVTLDADSFSGRVWWSHPKVRENKKIIICAVLLSIIGVALFALSVWMFLHEYGMFQSVVFLVLSLILAVPGLFHLVYVYLAVKGRRGYSFRQLPLFN